MKKAFDDYVHLAGSARSGCSLWEGPDHLLVIETMPLVGFNENYKRIDYTKIEAISYGRTSRFWWMAGWQLLLLALFTWGAIATLKEQPPIAPVLFGIVALLLLVTLIVYTSRGPSCVCKLQTAVQVLPLKPLNHVRRTLKVVTRLAELCRQHQGGMVTAETLLSAAATQASTTSRGLPSAIKPPFEGSRLITLALLLLLPAGVLTLAEPFVDNMAFFFVDGLWGMVAHVLAITGLARNFRYQLPASLKVSLWGLAVNLVLSFGVGYALMILSSIKHVESTMRSKGGIAISGPNQYDIWRWLSHASLQDFGWLAWPYMAIGVICILLALLGLPAALQPPARKTVAAPTAPPPIQPAENDPS